MKKFQFTLRALLQFRKDEETLRQKELFIAQTYLDRLTKELQELEQECLKLDEEIRLKEAIRLNAVEIDAHFTYIRSAKKKIVQYKRVLAETQLQVDRKRQALLKAMQKKKVVEHLQEKQLANWEYEYKEAEKAFFDELATIRYMRDKLKEGTSTTHE